VTWRVPPDKSEVSWKITRSACSSKVAKGSHAQVMGMQQALKDKGFDRGSVDGVMGPKTISALRDYQKSENLTATRQVGWRHEGEARSAGKHREALNG